MVPDEKGAAPQDPLFGLFLGIFVASIGIGAAAALADWAVLLTAVGAYVQLYPAAWLSERVEWLSVLPILGETVFEPSLFWHGAHQSMHGIGKTDWNNLQLAAGRTAFLLYGLPLAAVVFRLRKTRPDLTYRSIHTIDSLIGLQAISWPLTGIVRTFAPLSSRTNPIQVIKSVSAHNMKGVERLGQLLKPSQTASVPPPMEIALKPDLWLANEGLAVCGMQTDQHSIAPKRPSVVIDNALSNDAVCEVLETQLGPPWHGFDNLSPVHRALCAVFSFGFNGQRNDCERLLERLSLLSEHSVLSGHSFEQAIAKDRRLMTTISGALSGSCGARIRQAAADHAWQRTAFIAMLLAARNRIGILASASFVWLKREDRVLWFVLNAAGGRVAHAEAAGVCAHFSAESQIEQALHLPTVFQGGEAFIKGYLNIDPVRDRARHLMLEARKPVGQRLREAANHGSQC